MQSLIYWIWISLASTPGSQTFKKLFDKFGSVEAIYNADENDIISAIGSRSRDFSAVCNKNLDKATKIYQFCSSKGVGILTYSDELYPNSLRQIENPPALLYYRGVLPKFNDDCFVSVVGTRRLTNYGRKNAFSISYDLSRSGAVIVSGMAIGIDGVSLAGALASGATTVAVIGSGIDVCYPEEHKRLAREIVKRGCVMTEYAPGTKPKKQNFPIRNRIISAIGAATLVVEGRLISGALITARYSKKYNKPVYALPGNVDNTTSIATNLLIKKGAKLITAADDIIKDFEFVYLGKINPFKLSEKTYVNMADTLRELEVSCVTQSDDIFFPKRKRAFVKSKENNPSEKDSDREEPLATNSEYKPKIPENFDKVALEIYKKIPIGKECTVESLIDENHKMKDVMGAMLKLEMGKFITLLPGEKVKRN